MLNIKLITDSNFVHFSGSVVCLPCQTVRSWSAMEKFFKPSTSAKGNKDLDAVKEQFVKQKAEVLTVPIPVMAKLIHELPPGEFEKVLHHLHLEVKCVTNVIAYK